MRWERDLRILHVVPQSVSKKEKKKEEEERNEAAVGCLHCESFPIILSLCVCSCVSMYFLMWVWMYVMRK